MALWYDPAMPRRPAPSPAPPTRPPALLAAACAVALLAPAGCAGGGRDGQGGGIGGGGDDGRFNWFGLYRPEPPANQPMSSYERARLVARVRQDPGQLEKLTLRERIEVSRLAAAARNHDEDDRREERSE